MSNLRFGVGTTREIGMDLQDLGVKRTLLVIDPRLRDLPTGHTILESLRAARISFETFDAVEVEPTDHSFHEAIDFAQRGQFGGTLVELTMKLGHGGVGEVGRKLPGKAIEADVVLVQIVEEVAQIGKADAEVRLLGPAAAVIGAQGRADNLHGDA